MSFCSTLMVMLPPAGKSDIAGSSTEVSGLFEPVGKCKICRAVAVQPPIL